MTVVAAASAVLATQPDARVLLCAPAAFTADVLCSRMAEWSLAEAPTGTGGALEPAADVSRDERARGGHRESRRWSRTMARVQRSRRERAWSKATSFGFASTRTPPLREHARVVVTSCASAGVLADAVDDWIRDASPAERVDETAPNTSTRDWSRFTHVFVDEGAQATTPETLVPMRLTGERTRAVVLAGDPRQLGPVVHSAAAAAGDGDAGRGLTASLLEIAAEAHDDAAKTHPRAQARRSPRQQLSKPR